MSETKAVLESVKRDGTPSLKNEISCPKCGELCHIIIELELNKLRKRAEWKQIWQLGKDLGLVKGRLTLLCKKYNRKINSPTFRLLSQQEQKHIEQKNEGAKRKLDALEGHCSHTGVLVRKKKWIADYIRFRTYHRNNGKQIWCFSSRVQIDYNTPVDYVVEKLSQYAPKDLIIPKLSKVWSKIHSH